MLWIVAAGGCLVGILGIGMAVGTRLRIASLEQELAYWKGVRTETPLVGTKLSEPPAKPAEFAH